jgi:hypothetical protein
VASSWILAKRRRRLLQVSDLYWGFECASLGALILKEARGQEGIKEEGVKEEDIVMRTLGQRQKMSAVFSLLIITFCLGSQPLQAQCVTATLPTGSGPWAVAVNEVTNTIYVAS